MYFLENNLAGESGNERGDSYLQKVEGAVSQTIARAIRDATQSSDAARRQEAVSWLMICCPDIAEQMELPELYSDAMPALAAAYLSEKNGL
jgi:hypothetical protein